MPGVRSRLEPSARRVLTNEFHLGPAGLAAAGENIILNGCILGMSGKEVRERFGDIVAFAELRDFIDTPVKRYSSGMYIRLGFSVAVHSDPGVLLVDEVLAVGDAHFQEKCLAKMREFQSQGVTIVVVSHDMDLIEKFCHRALVMDSGHLVDEGVPNAVIPRYLEMVGHLPEMAVQGPSLLS